MDTGHPMETTVTEIAPDVFRISVCVGASRENVACFLLRDEEPAMVETNLGAAFDAVHSAVSSIVDPTELRYFFIPCFAMDECGALNRFLELAPNAQPVCSPPGMVTLTDFSARPARPLANGERVHLGRKTIMGVLTPWVPLWDSMMFYDETDRVIFTSDLFIQGNADTPVSSEDESDNIIAFYKRLGTMPSPAHIEKALQRIERLDVDVLAGMHGPVLSGDPTRYYRALREHCGEIAGLLDAPFYEMSFPVMS